MANWVGNVQNYIEKETPLHERHRYDYQYVNGNEMCRCWNGEEVWMIAFLVYV